MHIFRSCAVYVQKALQLTPELAVLVYVLLNKMQSETADFAPVPPPGELDDIRVVFDVALFPPLYETWRHPQNRKYIACHTVVRGGRSRGRR